MSVIAIVGSRDFNGWCIRKMLRSWTILIENHIVSKQNYHYTMLSYTLT